LHFQGTQQGIGGTSGFRGTQVEKHCSIVSKISHKIISQKFCENVMKIIAKLKLHFKAKAYILLSKMYQGSAKDAQFCVS